MWGRWVGILSKQKTEKASNMELDNWLEYSHVPQKDILFNNGQHRQRLSHTIMVPSGIIAVLVCVSPHCVHTAKLPNDEFLRTYPITKQYITVFIVRHNILKLVCVFVLR
jgi:hypothetical protein